MELPNEHRSTAEEFYSLMPDNTSERFELIEGRIYSVASPDILHQRISMRICRQISNFIFSYSGKYEVFAAPTDVRLNDETVVVPDIFVISDPALLDTQRYNGSPDWVIEIISSNRDHDLFRKLSIYKFAGVREYWIVDPKFKRIAVYFFENGEYPGIYTFDMSVPVSIFDGELMIDISDLLS